MLVSIIIVNWNAGHLLDHCIDSLEPLLLRGDVECIVVDNKSSDGSDVRAAARDTGVHVIRTGSNLGFASACNIGAKAASGARLLFLNPDTTITAHAFDRSLEFLDQPENNRVGIVGIQLKDASGAVSRSCARFPTGHGLVLHALGMDRLLPRWGHMMAEWPHEETRRVDHVIGAYYLMRTEAFEAIGGFDERYFVYLEDLDLSLRARKAGWESVFLADVSAFHEGGGTSAKVKARRLFYSLRSRLLYTRAHLGLISFLCVALATLALEPLIRTLHAIARGSGDTIRETTAAYGMLYRWLPRWWRQGDTRWNP